MKSIKLINDQALGDGNSTRDDGLGFNVYSEVLSNAISNTNGPFTIGIFGEWGSGKTSLMSLVKSKLTQNNNDIITVWFNAWEYEKEEHPLIPLVGTILSALEKKESKNLSKESHDFMEMLYGIASAFSGKAEASLLGQKVNVKFDGKNLNKKQEKNKYLFDKSLYKLAFEKLLELSQKNKVTKTIIFIDDLDRCFPNKAIKILESIKLAFALPNFIFVLGVSRNVIEGYLEHRFEKEYGLKNYSGKLYLDKIIQLPFYIPPHTGRMEEFSISILSAIDNIEVKNKLIYILPIIANAIGENPRAIIRYVNNLLIDISINNVLHEKQELELIEIEYFAISRYLQQYYPNIFLQLSLSNKICKEILQWNWESILEQLTLKEVTEYTNLAKLFYSNKELFSLLLETKEGHSWLENHSIRKSSIHFLKINREENNTFRQKKTYTIYISTDNKDKDITKQLTDIFSENKISYTTSYSNDTYATVILISDNFANSSKFKTDIEKSLTHYQNNKSYLIIPIILPGTKTINFSSDLNEFMFFDFEDIVRDKEHHSIIEQLKMLN